MNTEYIKGLERALELVKDQSIVRPFYQVLQEEIDRLKLLNKLAAQLHEIYKLGSGSRIDFDSLDEKHKAGIYKQAEWILNTYKELDQKRLNKEVIND